MKPVRSVRPWSGPSNALAVITDELDDDLDAALDICQRLRVTEVEVRTIGGRNWLALDEGELSNAVARIRSRGFRVSALASPIFKCPLPGAAAREGAALHGASGSATLADHWELLDRALERASAAGVPLIRIFSCWRVPDPTQVRDEVVEIVGEALRRAMGYPVEVALENEHDCNVATATETIALLDRVPELRIIWDPANHVRAGGSPSESTLDGYVDRIAHMHLKDVDATGTWVGLGHGLVPYEQVVGRLLDGGYAGAFSLETHCELDGSRVAASSAALEMIREYVGVAR